MKKRTLALTLAFLLMFSTMAFAARDIKITLNGQIVETDVKPFIAENRTQVPIRFISEALGYKVEWDDVKREVTVTKDNDVLVLTVGNTTSYLNGRAIVNDVAPKIVENRTFVPLRFIAENFNIEVDWDNDTSTVILIDNSKVDSDINAILGNIDISSLNQGEREYVEAFAKSQVDILAKLAEFKRYAFQDFDKYSKSELLINFNRITSEIFKLVAEVQGMPVPERFTQSNEYYEKTVTALLPMLDKYKLAFLEDDSQSALALIDQLTVFSMDATESLESLKAEIKGVPYVPQTDIQIYKDTQNEILDKLMNQVGV